MTVIYRLCGIASTNPSPIYQEDKRKLNELCLKSFVMAFRDVNPYVYFLMDYCDESYIEMLEKLVPFNFTYQLTNIGINNTALRAYEVAEESDDDVILFAECDHLWRPSVGKNFYNAVMKYGLVSPFDHPDFYNRYDIHDRYNEIDVLDNQHYRTATRNVMTFAMTKGVFEDSKDILKKYGYLDDLVWGELKERGHKLWVPIPSMDTHLVEGLLSPGIPWSVIWNIYK